ncbi:MAG: type II secretion system protein GspL [Candidatus Thiodiazotropha sp.]
MAEVFVLQCHDSRCEQVSWSIRGGPVNETAEGTLEEAALQARGRRTLVLIPASEVLMTHVRIPTRNRQRLLQAIPFSLENELTEDIDELHFAAGVMDDNQLTPVMVIARQRLEEWLSHLEEAGLEPMGLFVDLTCLPRPEGAWSLYQDPQFLLIQTQQNQGFSVDTMNAESVLGLALKQAQEHPPQKLVVHCLEGMEPIPNLDSIAPDCEITVQSVPSRSELTALLASNLNEKSRINLLQGQYLRVDKTTLQWKRWLPAVVLGAVFTGLSMATTVKDYYTYEQQSKALDLEIRKTFQDAFPDIKRIVDPRVQMEQQLKALQGSGKGFAQFSNLFIPAAEIVNKAPNTTLESISFRDGQLDLQLTIKELQALEPLKSQLRAAGLNVEIRSANASGSQVTSHIRITGAKS